MTRDSFTEYRRKSGYSRPRRRPDQVIFFALLLLSINASSAVSDIDAENTEHSRRRLGQKKKKWVSDTAAAVGTAVAGAVVATAALGDERVGTYDSEYQFNKGPYEVYNGPYTAPGEEKTRSKGLGIDIDRWAAAASEAGALKDTRADVGIHDGHLIYHADPQQGALKDIRADVGVHDGHLIYHADPQQGTMMTARHGEIFPPPPFQPGPPPDSHRSNNGNGNHIVYYKHYGERGPEPGPPPPHPNHGSGSHHVVYNKHYNTAFSTGPNFSSSNNAVRSNAAQAVPIPVRPIHPHDHDHDNSYHGGNVRRHHPRAEKGWTQSDLEYAKYARTSSGGHKKLIHPSDFDGLRPVQDQMVVISTVATMALLVGALSARRMRSRQFLGSCIENESLEDELAYDTAYTTGASTGYGAFTSAPWRGDLEKFDV